MKSWVDVHDCSAFIHPLDVSGKYDSHDLTSLFLTALVTWCFSK